MPARSMMAAARACPMPGSARITWETFVRLAVSSSRPSTSARVIVPSLRLASTADRAARTSRAFSSAAWRCWGDRVGVSSGASSRLSRMGRYGSPANDAGPQRQPAASRAFPGCATGLQLARSLRAGSVRSGAAPSSLEQSAEGVAGVGKVHVVTGHLAEQGGERPGGEVSEAGGEHTEFGDLVVVVEVEQGVADELEQVHLVESCPAGAVRPRGALGGFDFQGKV